MQDTTPAPGAGDAWPTFQPVGPPPNRVPVIDAGPARTWGLNATVKLVATAYDPDEDPMTVQWSWWPVSGTTGALSVTEATSCVATLATPSQPGSYVVSFVATDSRGASFGSTVAVQIVPLPPANRAPTVHVPRPGWFNTAVGQTVKLEAWASDPDGDPITCSWRQVWPQRPIFDPPDVTLVGAASSRPMFTASVNCIYDFEVTVTDTPSGGGTPLTSSVTQRVIVRPVGEGLLLYLTDQGGAQPLALARSDGTIAGGVDGIGKAAWTPNGRNVLAYRLASSSWAYYDVLSRRWGSAVPGSLVAPRLSPDGRTLAFETEQDGNAEIYVSSWDGSSPRNLTLGGSRDAQPAWSSQGDRIFFHSFRTGAFRLFSVLPDGSGVTQVAGLPGVNQYDIECSPDGRWLAWANQESASIFKPVWVSGVDGSGPVAVAPAATVECVPTDFSPDSARVTFDVPRGGTWDVGLVNRDGTGLRYLGSGSADEGDTMFQPSSRLPNRYPTVTLDSTATANPRVTLPQASVSYDLTLTVTDERGASATARGTLLADPVRPTASLAYQTADFPGGRASFTVPRTASIDVTFSETVACSPSSPAALLAAGSGPGTLPQRAVLTRLSDRSFRCSLVLTSGNANTYDLSLEASDLAGNELTAQPANRAFLVNRPPQFQTLPQSTWSGPVGERWARSFSASDFDAGQVVGYAWSVGSRPPGCESTAVTFAPASGALANGVAVESSIVLTCPGVWQLRLGLADGFGGTASTQILATAYARGTNSPPNAAIAVSPDTRMLIDSTVNLDGRGSSDAAGTTTALADLAAFSWTLQGPPMSTRATLSATTGPQVSFVPDVAGDYTATLVVRDLEGVPSAPARVVIRARVDETDNSALAPDLGASGTWHPGRLDFAADTDLFAFDPELGKVYEVVVESTVPLTAVVKVWQEAPANILGEATVPAGQAGRLASPLRTTRQDPAGGQSHAWRMYVLVAAADGSSRGDYQLAVTGRDDPAPFVPRARLLWPQPDGSLDAVLETESTSVPIGSFSAWVTYDPTVLQARPATLLGQPPFLLRAPELRPPSVSLVFDAYPPGSRQVLPPGMLARLPLELTATAPTVEVEPPVIREVQANAGPPAGLALIVSRPNADAGVSHQLSATAGVTPVVLDGRRSSPGKVRSLPANDPRARRPLALSYRCSQVGTSPTTVQLQDAQTAQPWFVPPAAGRYRFRLAVSNGTLDGLPDEVEVMVRTGRLEPWAAPVARDPRSGRLADSLSAALAVTTPASIELDATASVEPQAASSSAALTYEWRQVSGPETVPLSARAGAHVTAPLGRPGLYGFELSARSQSTGLAGAPRRVMVLAAAGAPGLSLESRDPVTRRTGPDLGAVPELAGGGSLRVSLSDTAPTSVELFAHAQVPTPGAAPRVVWRQTAGPVARLEPGPNPATDTTAVLQEPGLHEFACRLRTESSTTGALTAEAERRIRVLAEPAAISAPTAHLIVTRAPTKALFPPSSSAGGPGFGALGSELVSPSERPPEKVSGAGVPPAQARHPGRWAGKMAPHSSQKSGARRLIQTLSAQAFPPGRITLDGRSSQARPGARYQWTQIDGPTVELSSPDSPVTSFVAADPGQAQTYVFHLHVYDGQSAEPAVAAVRVVPSGSVPRTAVLTLEPGFNLVSIPLSPVTTGPAYRVSDLLRTSGAEAVIHTVNEGGTGRFAVQTRGLSTGGDPAVTSTAGYLLMVPRDPRRLVFEGQTWPAAAPELVLHRGLNLVAFPAGVPAGATASTLATTAGATFVLRTWARPGERTRFDAYLPNVSSHAFTLETSRGYLLFAPEARRVRLGR